MKKIIFFGLLMTLEFYGFALACTPISFKTIEEEYRASKNVYIGDVQVGNSNNSGDIITYNAKITVIKNIKNTLSGTIAYSNTNKMCDFNMKFLYSGTYLIFDLGSGTILSNQYGGNTQRGFVENGTLEKISKGRLLFQNLSTYVNPYGFILLILVLTIVLFRNTRVEHN